MNANALAITALVCGIVVLAAPQLMRWAVGIWLILYGVLALFR